MITGIWSRDWDFHMVLQLQLQSTRKVPVSSTPGRRGSVQNSAWHSTSEKLEA